MTDLNFLRRRAQMLRNLRDFFAGADFLEVDTPVAIDAPAPEEYIESITASNHTFLRTSPELAMKMLLSAGLERIYQIGSCFRFGEYGRRHREEFTMLEYYAKNWDYRKLADFTCQMVRAAVGAAVIEYQGEKLDLSLPPEYITVADAFAKCTAMDVFEADKSDKFDELMVTEIEPRLGRGRLTFLLDYPASRASLAQLKNTDTRFAERWEMYLGGVELANAFGELTDPVEQKQRFEAALAYRQKHHMVAYPAPLRFYQALAQGLPHSSGSALGFDRLLMLACNAENIGQVRVDNE